MTRRFLLAPLLLAGALGSPLHAQAADPAPLEPPDARVAALDVALYNAQANVIEATDTARAVLATTVLDSTLQNLLGAQLAEPETVRSVADSDTARAITGGLPCNVIVACARHVATTVDVPWVVMAKVSKTSNLIWLLTAQLIHAPSGTIVLDDTTELKGEPEAMVRAGTRIFAERVARTVRAGGVVNNFPTP
ncbi:MAG: DUF2380 domain-containing protein [Gemmatimonadales bacterium]|nr:DUF2380 domain-containing protein [Gemmatimonadales bacterium]